MEQGAIGFIGAGNMGTALIKGLINSGFYPSERIFASDKDESKLEKLSREFGVNTNPLNQEIARACRIIILCVKPYHIRDAMKEIKGDLNENHLVVSIVAGVPLKSIRNMIDRDIGKVPFR